MLLLSTMTANCCVGTGSSHIAAGLFPSSLLSIGEHVSSHVVGYVVCNYELLSTAKATAVVFDQYSNGESCTVVHLLKI